MPLLTARWESFTMCAYIYIYIYIKLHHHIVYFVHVHAQLLSHVQLFATP